MASPGGGRWGWLYSNVNVLNAPGLFTKNGKSGNNLGFVCFTTIRIRKDAVRSKLFTSMGRDLRSPWKVLDMPDAGFSQTVASGPGPSPSLLSARLSKSLSPEVQTLTLPWTPALNGSPLSPQTLVLHGSQAPGPDARPGRILSLSARSHMCPCRLPHP